MKDLIIWMIVIGFIAAQIPAINGMFNVLNDSLSEVTANTFLVGNLHDSLSAVGDNPFYNHLVIYLSINLIFKVI